MLIFIFLVPGFVFGKNLVPPQDKKNLELAKYYIIEGLLEKANFYLNELSLNKYIQSKNNFYKSNINFIQENFIGSIKNLNRLKASEKNSKIDQCALFFINKFKINEDYTSAFNKCKVFNNDFKNKSFLFTNILNYKNQKYDLVQENLAKKSKELNDFYELKKWLKLVLLTKNEEFILDYLAFIPGKFYKYRSIRELLATIFFRLRDFKKASKLSINLKSKNSENILGNISIEKKDFQNAYGHFLYSNKKSPTSINSLKKHEVLYTLL